MTASVANRNRPDRVGGQERRCLVTRESGARDGLIRFVVGPDGEVVPDLAERLPGRGLWLTARRDIVQTACAKGAFARAARRSVKVPDDLGPRIEMLLARRCVELIGLARRAGLVTTGFEKVRAALAAGQVALLLAPIGAPGRDAMELAGRAGSSRKGSVVRRALLTRAELGAAVGRDDAVHVALSAAPMTDRIDREFSRLAGFRTDQEPEGDVGDDVTYDEAVETGRG